MIALQDERASEPPPPPGYAECMRGLVEANTDFNAVNRALAPDAQAAIGAASVLTGVDPHMLGAIGIRETGFRNIRQANGHGRGVFQIDLGQHPNVTDAQAMNMFFSAYYAADLLRTNQSTLAAKFPHFSSLQLSRATAAAYNFGTGNIRGNPNAIDRGTTGNNYGRNILDLMHCFR